MNPSRTRPPLRLVAVVATALLVPLLTAPAAGSAPERSRLSGPTNLRVTAMTPHSVTLAWNPAANAGSFVYVIRLVDTGYQLGVSQTETTFTWVRDLVPGRTYSFVMWAADQKGRRSADSNTVTVTLPVDVTPPAAPSVSVTGVTHSAVSLAWPPVADDDASCCAYRVVADGVPVRADELQWTGDSAVTVLRLAPATTHTFTVAAVDPSGNVSAPSAPVTATTSASTDGVAPSAPANVYGFAFDCGEVWLFWEESTDDVDPPASIQYEVRVNGVLDGAVAGIDRWIAYGNVTGANTFTVQAVDSSGNRSAPSSLTLDLVLC